MILFNKNIIITFLSISVFLNLGCRTSGNEKESPKRKPNIVLINVDDLGWKDLGFMGSEYYETPHVDALAKEGLVFTNAYAGAANCAPSRACLLSGLNTPWHGIYTVSPSDRGNPKTRKLIPIKNTKHLNDTIYTLPQMLKSAGYTTANFGKWHVGDNPLKQGIDYNIGGSGKGNPGKNGYFSPYNIDNIEDGPDGEYLTDRLTTEAISFIEKSKDTTFFVYLPYYTVHTPIMGKEHLIEKFKNKQGFNGQNNPKYAAMVASMDENVGKLLRALKENGLEENTLVIFTSDNGGIRSISSQKPLRAGKGSYYEGGIRVPLIIKWPNHVKANTSTNQNVSNLDFYPTLQNITQPNKKAPLLDGIDLSPLYKGALLENRDLFYHFPIYLQNYSKNNDGSRDPLFRTRPGSVIISGNWKLHHYFEDNALEMYNLENDISEKNNLAKEYPEKAATLYKKLEDWRIKNNTPIPTEKNPDYDAEFEKQSKTIKSKDKSKPFNQLN
jgi:arylsulfatase A-like enzyme